MKCSNCKYLNKKYFKEGKVSGVEYWCEHKKEYIRASDSACEKIIKNEKISIEDIKKIEQEGKEYYDDTIPIGVLVFIIIIFIMIGLFMGVFEI